MDSYAASLYLHFTCSALAPPGPCWDHQNVASFMSALTFPVLPLSRILMNRISTSANTLHLLKYFPPDVCAAQRPIATPSVQLQQCRPCTTRCAACTHRADAPGVHAAHNRLWSHGWQLMRPPAGQQACLTDRVSAAGIAPYSAEPPPMRTLLCIVEPEEICASSPPGQPCKCVSSAKGLITVSYLTSVLHAQATPTHSQQNASKSS